VVLAVWQPLEEEFAQRACFATEAPRPAGRMWPVRRPSP